jgi:hypothetical protein
MPTRPGRVLYVAAFVLLTFFPAFGAPTSLPGGYDSLYQQLLHLSVDPSRVAVVNNLILRRDAGILTLKSGFLCFCRPVCGRTVGAFYTGSGTFSMCPPAKTEREQLQRFLNRDSVNIEIGNVFLLFADTTAEELTGSVQFLPGSMPDVEDAIEDALAYISNEDERSFRSEFVQTFLHGDVNSLFYAHITAMDGTPYFFEVNPFNIEQITFLREDDSFRSARVQELLSSFPAREADTSPSLGTFTVSHYAIEAAIAQGLDFTATASMTITSERDSLRWLHLQLAPGLVPDSAWTRPGMPARLVRGEEGFMLIAGLTCALRKGDICTLTIAYHGDLLERNEFGWISLASTIFWYPRANRNKMSSYALTFRVPHDLTLVSIGTREHMETTGETTTTVWRSDRPLRDATFTIGHFRETTPGEHELEVTRQVADSLPHIGVYTWETGHRTIANALASQGILSVRDADEDIVADVVNSAAFYAKLFGRCPVPELRAAETPNSTHSYAFPGLLQFSWKTYQFSIRNGGNELHRAHEVAHQWWGIGVECATYHDAWLSEAFSEYSALMYIQTLRKENDLFFETLDTWRDAIISNRHFVFGNGQEAGPIWLGYRTQSRTTQGDYDLIVYRKGAWVLHMLRNLLLDLGTMREDLFLGIMRKFFTLHNGDMASTDDFQKIVEEYAGTDMEWFFREWIKETGVPTYHFAYRADVTADKKVKVTCRIRQENVTADFRMYVPLLIRFGENRIYRLRLLVTGDRTDYELPLLPLMPQTIVFNDLDSVLCEVVTEDWE